MAIERADADAGAFRHGGERHLLLRGGEQFQGRREQAHSVLPDIAAVERAVSGSGRNVQHCSLRDNAATSALM
jgi:hypothetical protein